MTPLKKIYILAGCWLVLTIAVFSFVAPRLSASMISLENSHEAQIKKLQDVTAQVDALQKIQDDLAKAAKQDVKPSDLFTSDIRLVNEIKSIEQFAAKSNVAESLTVTGTADKAQVVPGASGLIMVPYTIVLKGTFPGAVNFMRYLENAYFMSPVNAYSMLYNEQGSITATILTNFYLYK
jgi:hypothetical protein